MGTLDSDYQLTENPITIPEVYDRPFYPQPSPDGRAIAFVDVGNSIASEPSRLITGQWDRATNTLHSTEEVASHNGNIWFPKYSPDGSRLAWVERIGQERHLAYITLGEPSAVTRIPLEDVFPLFAWSPNSDALAYIDINGGPINIIGLDSSEIRTVTIPQPSIDGIDNSTFEIGFQSLQWIAD